MIGAVDVRNASDLLDYAVLALGIVAFALLCAGLMRLAGDDAPRGRRLVGIGVVVAVVASLVGVFNNGAAPSVDDKKFLYSGDVARGLHVTVPLVNWILIAAGLVIGVVVALLLARRVSAPQILTLLTGLGAGAVALVALAEFQDTDGFADFRGQVPSSPTVVGVLAAALLGSVASGASLVGFADEIGSRSALLRTLAQRRAGVLFAVVALGLTGYVAFGAATGGGAVVWWAAGILLAGALAGACGLLPSDGALLKAVTGAGVGALGIALDSPPLIVGGLVVVAACFVLFRSEEHSSAEPAS
ncbi:MAG: NAD(P)(+) transhydrogenase (Re/Si-specific) subunit beta [Gordonia sp. (in: high G+C Gram-positive bacteria)]